MKKLGKFITFEGGEGCGKTTIIESLKKVFDEKKIDYVVTREPGGLKICEDIRNILKYSTEKIGDKAELLLFSASRAELVEDLIKPALESGKIVLSDRFFDSSRVYQGYAKGISDDEIMKVTNFATGGLFPDITFYLDIAPEIAFQRKGGKDKGDRIEQRDMEYHNMVRKGFQILAQKEKRFVTLDATKTINELTEIILQKLKE